MPNFGTTTYANRHTDRLTRLNELCAERNIHQPSILEMGPGGVVSFLFNAWQKGHKSSLSNSQKVKRFLGRIAENGLRRFGVFRLKTSEPYEIIEHLSNFQPNSIGILDLDKKVLKDLSKQFRKNAPAISFQLYHHDISSKQLNQKFDLVIAYLIIERCKMKEMAIANLFNSVNLGGIISTSYDQIQLPTGFIELEKGFYQRID